MEAACAIGFCCLTGQFGTMLENGLRSVSSTLSESAVVHLVDICSVAQVSMMLPLRIREVIMAMLLPPLSFFSFASMRT